MLKLPFCREPHNSSKQLSTWNNAMCFYERHWWKLVIKTRAGFETLGNARCVSSSLLNFENRDRGKLFLLFASASARCSATHFRCARIAIHVDAAFVTILCQQLSGFNAWLRMRGKTSTWAQKLQNFQCFYEQLFFVTWQSCDRYVIGTHPGAAAIMLWHGGFREASGHEYPE